jgi:hypothetical protein
LIDEELMDDEGVMESTLLIEDDDAAAATGVSALFEAVGEPAAPPTPGVATGLASIFIKAVAGDCPALPKGLSVGLGDTC